MLKIKILIIIFCCIGVVKAQTVIPPSSETPPGWIYYDGDEFNGDVIDSRYWGIYGSQKVGRPTYNQENKAMLQTYRPEQVFIETLPTGEKICRIHSFKSKDAPSPVHPSVKSKTGWWSGALSSRDSDTEKYYPLFCRIEIKAKVPYLYGLWNALWLRHYKGAGVAEIDILEFFTKAFGKILIRPKRIKPCICSIRKRKSWESIYPKVRYDILKSETISREIISMYMRFR